MTGEMAPVNVKPTETLGYPGLPGVLEFDRLLRHGTGALTLDELRIAVKPARAFASRAVQRRLDAAIKQRERQAE